MLDRSTNIMLVTSTTEYMCLSYTIVTYFKYSNTNITGNVTMDKIKIPNKTDSSVLRFPMKIIIAYILF